MGCAKSKEDDSSSAGLMQTNTTYINQAEDAAELLSGAEKLSSRLQLSISCNKLKNMDKFSKSDPFVVVRMQSPPDVQEWVEVGRTEIISNTLDPQFVTLIPVTYRFEEVQTMRFEVYDADSSFNSTDSSCLNLQKQDHQGYSQCVLAQIVGSRGQTWQGDLQGGTHEAGQGSAGSLVVRLEEVANSNMVVEFQLKPSELKGGSSSRFIRLSRVTEEGSPLPCFKTEALKKNTPLAMWRTIKLPLQVLANGDLHRPLLLEVFTHKSNGNHVLVGSCKASVKDIEGKAQDKTELTLSNGGGKVGVESCILTQEPSFFDYLGGGMEVQFSVAVDYTASNGDPSMSGTLHYHDPTGQSLNQYGQAIYSVGGVLEFYDHDRLFPVYGFGGSPYRGAPANHCFAVNGNEDCPEVQGVPSVLDVYRGSLTRIVLSGPTLFAPVISQAASIAASQVSMDPTKQKYTVLLLLTDGVISDMDNTIKAIVASANLPFSIVIVGVGDADFEAMEILDGDEDRLSTSGGQKSVRDIVQFVPFREFQGKSVYALAKEVLAEIPGQVLEYMKANGITPGPRAHGIRQGSIGSMIVQDSMGVGTGLGMHGLQHPGSIQNSAPNESLNGHANQPHHAPTQFDTSDPPHEYYPMVPP